MESNSKDACIAVSIGGKTELVYLLWQREADEGTILGIIITIEYLQDVLQIRLPFCADFHVSGNEERGVRLRIADMNGETLRRVARTALKNLGLMKFCAAFK